MDALLSVAGKGSGQLCRLAGPAAGNAADFDRKRALVIGDSLTSDMKGGINVGIDTCWYTPKGLITELPVTYNVSSFEEIMQIILCEESADA